MSAVRSRPLPDCSPVASTALPESAAAFRPLRLCGIECSRAGCLPQAIALAREPWCRRVRVRYYSMSNQTTTLPRGHRGPRSSTIPSYETELRRRYGLLELLHGTVQPARESQLGRAQPRVSA